MKPTVRTILSIVLFFFFITSSLYPNASVEKNYLHANYGSGENAVEAKAGVRITQEGFAAARTTYLNDANNIPVGPDYQSNYDAAMNDRNLLFRSTTDFLLSFNYGESKKPRLKFYNCLRFRYVFGGPGVVSTANPTFEIGGTSTTLSSLSIPKNLLWTNEAWLHIAFNKHDDVRDHFLRTGLFPYDIGRGIALGSAYASSGFLGASPEFSIDQFAPAAWIHAEILPQKFDFNTYFALLVNQSDTPSDNNAPIRTQDLSEEATGNTRGTSTQVWLLSLSSRWYPINNDDHRAVIEPFLIQYHAPDQTLEYYADSNLYLRTWGVSVEHFAGDFEWGFETGFNGGHQEIRGWDRNQATLSTDLNGNLQVQYTQVYLVQEGTTLNVGSSTTVPAFAATSIATTSGVDFNIAQTVANSTQDQVLNGQQLNPEGDYLKVNTTATGGIVNYNLVNSEIRFRPEQRVYFDGFYCVADVGYQILKDRLKVYAGVGYASGELDDLEVDVNSFSQDALLNRKFHGFFPIQSVYSGNDRLNLFVLLNQGVPRFDLANPVPTVPNKNYITPIQGTQNTLQINAFTNLMYMGGAIEWKPEWLGANSGVKLNVIYYRMPVTPIIPGTSLHASSSLGTEINIRQVATIFERVSLCNAAGVLFPGQLYTDMMGTSLGGGISGDSPTYVLNVGIRVAF